MARRRHMTALQRKYFGKGHSVHHKRKRTYAVSVHHKRRTYRMAKRHSYSRGRIGGGIKSMLPGILAGVGDSYLDPMLPIDGVSAVAVGMFMKSPTIRDIGLYKVGFSIGNIIPLPGRGSTSSGGLL